MAERERTEAEEAAAVRRWRRGQTEAEQRQQELRYQQGPRPEQAIAECFAALDAMMAMGLWPGGRDPASEREVEEVRERWARIQRRARREHRR